MTLAWNFFPAWHWLGLFCRSLEWAFHATFPIHVTSIQKASQLNQNQWDAVGSASTTSGFSVFLPGIAYDRLLEHRQTGTLSAFLLPLYSTRLCSTTEEKCGCRTAVHYKLYVMDWNIYSFSDEANLKEELILIIAFTAVPWLIFFNWESSNVTWKTLYSACSLIEKTIHSNFEARSVTASVLISYRLRIRCTLKITSISDRNQLGYWRHGACRILRAVGCLSRFVGCILTWKSLTDKILIITWMIEVFWTTIMRQILLCRGLAWLIQLVCNNFSNLTMHQGGVGGENTSYTIEDIYHLAQHVGLSVWTDLMLFWDGNDCHIYCSSQCCCVDVDAITGAR